MRYGLLIVPDLCIGCRACQVACKSWNGLPAEKTKNRGTHENPSDLTGYTYNRIRFIERVTPKGEVNWVFVSQRCRHCGEPACVAICPAGAMQKDEETGIVFYDKNTCIGCQACRQACPFKIPRYDKEGKVSKCHLCIDRVKAGLLPACAKTCPTGAIRFGKREELLDWAKKEGYKLIHGEKELGGLGVMFALSKEPKYYDLVEKPVVREDLIALGQVLRVLVTKKIPLTKSIIRKLFA
jgi:formate dehydrogenase iron-sulfur subunit